MILPLLLSVAAVQPADDCSTIKFHRLAALAGQPSERVQVCVERSEQGGPSQYRFRMTGSWPDRQAEASTRTCPAARQQLEALEEMRLPAPDVLGLGREPSMIVMDGADYRLEIDGRYGPHSADLVVSSNVDTPLARWIDATLDALHPCWRDTASLPEPPPAER